MKKKRRDGTLFCDLFSFKRAASFLLSLLICFSLFFSFSFDVSADPVYGVDIHCYVAINGVWQQVEVLDTADGAMKWAANGKDRNYITAETAEKVFGAYGFKAAEYNGELTLPHTDSYDPKTIWADTPAKYVDGEWRIPLSFRNTIYLYYMPSNLQGNDTFFNTKISVSDSKAITANTFYTCRILDSEGKAYPDATKIPTVTPVYHGETLSVTLKKLVDGDWYVYDPNTGNAIDHAQTDNGDGTVTIIIEELSQPVYISSAEYSPSAHLIHYQAATLADSLVTLGSFTPEHQSVIMDGTVRGGETYTMYGSGTQDVVVIAPDSDLAQVMLVASSGDPAIGRKYSYTFKGWEIYGTSILVSPGDKLTVAMLDSYAIDGEVTLKAVWEGSDAKGRISSANFFINLNCEISDNMSQGFNPQPVSIFSDCVYSSRVLGTDKLSGNGEYLLIAPPTEQHTAYEVDKQLRASSANPIDGVTVESFPTDESVFAALRASGKKIRVNGQEYSGDTVTSERFSIRWYVLKYQNSDGWHIDGVLVVKQARMTVTKTFGGDNEAIDLIKNGDFKILVRHSDNESKKLVTDYVLCLEPQGQETVAGTLGYESYDETTQTYMWSFIGRQGRDYLFDEENYMLTDTVQWHNSNSYMISHSENATNGWQPYDVNASVHATAAAYPSDVPDAAIQTVAFRNIYVQAGLLSVTKIDCETNHGLKNVKFKISSADGAEIRLYKKKDKSQYSADTNAPADGYPELVPNNEVITDGTGNFYIKLPVGSYYLDEEVPLGYDGAKRILVTVTDDGIIQFATIVISGDAEPEGGWIDGIGTAMLTVKNRSKLLTVVRAEKDWGNTPESMCLPVKIELYRNGSKMLGDIYTQILSAENGWAYEWNGLPLYIDGEVAVYTLREVYIGDSAYDPAADTDGYLDYLVSVDPALYREGTLSPYGQAAVWVDSSGQRHFADHCLLRVHNRPSSGEISFKKTDGFGTPLAGAEFTLYSDAECTNILEKAVSAEGSGFVTFSLRPFGTYYLKETKAPDGYIADDDVYVVVVRGGVVTIIDAVGLGDPVTSIKNEALMSLTVKKVNSVGQTLAGAEFEILKNESLYAKFVIGEDGTYHLSNMPDGEYRIVETKAPEGYRERPDFAVLTILAGKVTVTSANAKGWALTDDGDGDYTLTVVNEVIYDLPTVGGSGVYTYVFIGIGMMLAATAVLVVIMIVSKKKKK